MKKSDVKLKFNKSTNETTADYYNVIDKKAFRYCLLKNMAQDKTDITIVIDTNQCVCEQQPENTITSLKSAGIEALVMAIAANPQHLLGFKFALKKSRHRESLIVFQMAADRLTPELFDELCVYDIAACFGLKKPLEAVCDDLRLDGIAMADEMFDEVYYDSIVCSSIRCSFDAQKTIKETTDEMGL